MKMIFVKLRFSADYFTDSRSVFQFYNLKYLWSHIQQALTENIALLHLASEPIGAAELYFYLKGHTFNNDISKNVPHYDFRTRYADFLGGKNGYLFDKDFVLGDIKNFVEGYIS